MDRGIFQKWAKPGVLGNEVPQYGRGAKPPEAEAKCEISVQFLTFSSRKVWIKWVGTVCSCCANIQLKKFRNFQWEGVKPPLGTPVYSPHHCFVWDDWKHETWHRETGQLGTVSQGWTSRYLFHCASRSSIQVNTCCREYYMSCASVVCSFT